MRRFNLLPAWIIQRRKRDRLLHAWLRFGCAYTLLIATAAFSADVMAPTDARAMSATAEGLRDEIIVMQRAISDAEATAEELRGRARVLDHIEGQPDWSILLEHLSEQLVGDAMLQDMRVELAAESEGGVTPRDIATGPYRISVMGVAEDQFAASQYVISLQDAGLLRQVALGGMNRVGVGESKAVQFILTAVVSAEEAR